MSGTSIEAQVRGLEDLNSCNMTQAHATRKQFTEIQALMRSMRIPNYRSLMELQKAVVMHYKAHLNIRSIAGAPVSIPSYPAFINWRKACQALSLKHSKNLGKSEVRKP
jgi:hypothetical protein